MLINSNSYSYEIFQPYYMYRGPLIFYWIVEHHYPDRCMRQFGKFQVRPPPPPIDRHTHANLHKYDLLTFIFIIYVGYFRVLSCY